MRRCGVVARSAVKLAFWHSAFAEYLNGAYYASYIIRVYRSSRFGVGLFEHAVKYFLAARPRGDGLKLVAYRGTSRCTRI